MHPTCHESWSIGRSCMVTEDGSTTGSSTPPRKNTRCSGTCFTHRLLCITRRICLTRALCTVAYIGSLKLSPRPLTCSSSIPSGMLISCKRLVEGFPRPADPLPPPDDLLILLLPLLLLLVPNDDLERGASTCRDNDGNLPRVCDPRMPDIMSSKGSAVHTHRLQRCQHTHTRQHDTPHAVLHSRSGTREVRIPMRHNFQTAEPPGCLIH